jgi:hypothetical protein
VSDERNGRFLMLRRNRQVLLASLENHQIPKGLVEILCVIITLLFAKTLSAQAFASGVRCSKSSSIPFVISLLWRNAQVCINAARNDS